MRFAGDIWPIHPTHDTILGLPCYRSVADLPGAPDACFIGVNRNATLAIVEQLSQRGSGGAVCFASGFSEAAKEDDSGTALQQQLLLAAGSMSVIGPNCYGLINYLDGALLWPDQHGGERVSSGIAVITQSSNMAINITMQQRALPVAYVMTAGNQAQTGIADMGIALLQDDRVTALGLHIEGFGDIRGFEQLAACAQRLGKGIVAIKVGRSEKAQSAMVSHTNSLTGTDAASDALLKRLGIARVNSIPVLLEALKALHVFGPMPGNTVASMSCSGGEASLMADSVHQRDLVFPDLSVKQQQGLRDALGPMVALANPLDYHTYIWNDLAKMTATFAAMLQDAADLTFLVIDFPREDRCAYDSWQVAIDALLAARDATGARVALLVTMPENIAEALANKFMQQGLPTFYGIEESLDAMLACVDIGRLANNASTDPVLIQTPRNTPVQLLTETQSKAVLRTAGLTVPASSLAGDTQQAIAAAKEIGYPVVLKVVGVAHKTELNGVYLNLSTEAAVAAAAQQLFSISESVLVEEYIDQQVTELLIGVVRDAANTFMLTLGAGGMLTELMRDTTTLLLPATDQQIESALLQLRSAALLTGYRNRPGADTAAIVQSIQRLCQWVQSNASVIEEIEINPLICLPQRAVVADALIRTRPLP